MVDALIGLVFKGRVNEIRSDGFGVSGLGLNCLESGTILHEMEDLVGKFVPLGINASLELQ